MQSPGESWTTDDACVRDHAAVPSTTAGCIGLFFSREAGLVAGSAAARSSITGRSRAAMSGAMTSRVCVDFVEVEVTHSDAVESRRARVKAPWPPIPGY